MLRAKAIHGFQPSPFLNRKPVIRAAPHSLQKLASVTITDPPQFEQKRGVAPDISGAEGDLGIAKPDRVAVGQERFGHALSTNICAVMAAEVFEMEAFVRGGDDGVMARD